MLDFEIQQQEICKKYGTFHFPADFNLKVGIALNVRESVIPVNGLRLFPEGDTTGWYVWAGEDFSKDDDFFKPLHVKHLLQWNPQILKYLGLPPGWRFLIANDYEDVWYDESLLNV